MWDWSPATLGAVYALPAAVVILSDRSRGLAFTTFLVFLLLLHSNPHDAAARFNERLVETLLGVGIADVFGLTLPALIPERARRGRPT